MNISINQLLRRGAAGAVLLTAGTLSGASTQATPAVAVPQIAAPAIDGILTRGEWSNAGRLVPFSLCGTGGKTQVATLGFIGRDEANIYIALICEEPQMASLPLEAFSGHDQAVWKNDSIELLFQTNPESPVIRQFIIDALNQSYDALGSDSFSFNPEFSSAVNRSEGMWVLEAAIPFAALTDQPPVSGQEFRVGVYRSRPSANELQAWSPTGEGFMVPKRFGHFVFDSDPLALLNRETVYQRAHADFGETLPEDIQRLIEQLDIALTATETFDFATPVAEYVGSTVLIADFARQYEEKCFYAQWLAVGLPVAFQAVNALDPAVPAPTAAPPEDALCAAFLKEEVRDFAFVLTNMSDQPQTIQILVGSETANDVLNQEIPGFSVRQYAAYPVATYDKSIAYDVLAENPTGIYRLAPNATLQSVITVQALPTAAEETRAKLTLRPIDGAQWNPYSLDWNLSVEATSVNDGSHPFLTFGWDAISSDTQEKRPAFTQAHFNALANHGFNAIQVSGKIHLPRPQTDANGIFTGELDFTNLDLLLSQTKDRFPYYILSPAIFNKHIFSEDLFGIPFDSPAYEVAYKAWLEAIFDRFDKHDISQNRIFFTPDYESANEPALRLCRWTKEKTPECQILLTGIPYETPELEAFARYVDIWMPNFEALKEKRVKNVEAIAKNPMMAYFSSTGRDEKTKHPFADYTVKFWSCFDRGLNGLAFASAGRYSGDPLYRAAFPGYDAALFYPAGSSVQPSRRALAWRRGLQDYLMLKQTEALLEETSDTEKLMELRQKVKDVIRRSTYLEGADEVRDFCRRVLNQKNDGMFHLVLKVVPK